MFSKIRKMLKKQDGFTLIELMTVLIILGVILGIGVPKYIQVQKKAKYDADVATLESMARIAETYAVSWQDEAYAGSEDGNGEVSGEDLIGKGLIDESEFILNKEEAGIKDIKFEIDANGRVTNLSGIINNNAFAADEFNKGEG